jgi:hypothetical protein
MRISSQSRAPFVDLIQGLMLIGLLGLVVGVAFWLWPDAAREPPDPSKDPARADDLSMAAGPARDPGPPAWSVADQEAPPGTETNGPPGPASNLAESAAQREERRLLNHLRQQGVSAEARGQLRRQEVVLAPELMSHLTDSSNWMPELMKASSSVQSRRDGEPTRLALDRVEADSILWELGLQEGDVIVLVQGEIPHFSPTRALDYIRQADAALAAFDQGEPITLTVLRRGQPVHLVYQPW